jgi:ribosomal protein S18 acetylase RimI-like enzyme
VTRVLLNCKDRVEELEIKELLAYSLSPDPDAVHEIVKNYKSDDALQLYGYESEEEIVGIIGIRILTPQQIEIENIAVKSEYRGAGFGRGQILELIDLLKPSKLIAETDDEAVEFYRRIGFEIKSLGEKYPGVERFRCTYEIEENDS